MMISGDESFELDDLVAEETEHVDEKWLISYADMMTLLFGLFVLLYAMKMELVQKAAQAEFSAAKAVSRPKPVVEPVAPVHDTAGDLLRMQEKYSVLERNENALKTVIANQQAQIVKLQKVVGEMDSLRDQVANSEGQVAQIRRLQHERDDLKSKLAEMEQPLYHPKPSVGEGASVTRTGSGFAGGIVDIGFTSGDFVSRANGVSLGDIHLKTTPPESLGSTFMGTLTGPDGDTVEVKCLSVPWPNGQPSQRVVIISIIKGEAVLRSWIEQANHPGGQKSQ